MQKFMNGWVNGFIGVAIFAGSLPATRVAVTGFEPGFLTAARAVIAGVLGLILIFLLKEKKPAKQDWWPLAIVALGVVVGFPLFTALALQYMNAAHYCHICSSERWRKTKFIFLDICNFRQFSCFYLYVLFVR